MNTPPNTSSTEFNPNDKTPPNSAGTEIIEVDGENVKSVVDANEYPLGFRACESVENYEFMNQIGTGSYGVVSRARCKKTGDIVALKRIKLPQELLVEGFPTSALREISTLMQMQHPNLVNAHEVVVGSDYNKIFVVMDYMDHTVKDLNEIMKQRFTQAEVKCLLIQLLDGVKYMHDNWVQHRDIKTSNLLLDNHGNLKICDFGLARKYSDPPRAYSPVVVTLYYRAIEILLGEKKYTPAIDMWSVGCVFAELLLKKPLFQGNGELDQIKQIFDVLGLPSESRWEGFQELPNVKKFHFTGSKTNNLHKRFTQQIGMTNNLPILSKLGLDLLERMLEFDPKLRITADEALKHPYFKESPLPKSKVMMPTFPATVHETGHRGHKRKHDEIVQEKAAPENSLFDRELQDLYEQNVNNRDSIF
ncbi:CDKG-2 [Acrasis kona]|uniref:CDKG-2 n=1 Tax=Acrasis kona TaxID=1008807 RepID=A0AAW2YIB8_9EUKA